MFRTALAASLSRYSWIARPAQTSRAFSRVSLTSFRVALGVTGATLYFLANARTLHADESLPNAQENGPHLDSDSDDSSKKYMSRLVFDSPSANGLPVEFLREASSSYIPNDGSGVARFDSIVVPSNLPAEDYIASAFCHLPNQTWSLFAVFDGHNGPHTSSFLSDNLIPAVVGSLADLFSKQESVIDEHTLLGADGQNRLQPPPQKGIIDTIKEAFKRVDDDIVNIAVERAFAAPSKEAAVNLLGPAQAGSCAIMSFYESNTRFLRVAVTGDSRAVLGRRKDDNAGNVSYEVHVLSLDQNAHNPAEEARMSAMHPGEKIMDNGRVMGWGMSRAFGDATFKWKHEVQQRLNKEYLGDPLRPIVKTPPYFTAEPEVTTIEVRPGDFLILASDGLWDCLTNEEVVGLVGIWLTKHQNLKLVAPSSREPADMNTKEIIERNKLPVELKEDKTVMYRWWHAKKRFINIDDNVATHLARNALGGADSDLTAALLGMSPPRSRRYRDDLSAVVVFFDE